MSLNSSFNHKFINIKVVKENLGEGAVNAASSLLFNIIIMINQKSIESYHQMLADGTISIRQKQVLTCLKNELGQGTNRMIAKKLGWDINRVTGRITELREKDLVVHAGDYYDNDTNRTVNLWKCK